MNHAIPRMFESFKCSNVVQILNAPGSAYYASIAIWTTAVWALVGWLG